MTHNLPLCPLPPLLQAYANSRGIGLVGDMPIYVGGQSADVWAHRDLFELQPDGTPALVRCAVYALRAQAGVVGIAVEWGHMGVGGCVGVGRQCRACFELQPGVPLGVQQCVLHGRRWAGTRPVPTSTTGSLPSCALRCPALRCLPPPPTSVAAACPLMPSVRRGSCGAARCTSGRRTRQRTLPGGASASRAACR